MATHDIAPAQANGFAMETRAEMLKIATGGNALRRGDTEELHAGGVEYFSDVVHGEEQATILGALSERTEGGSTFTARRTELTVNGRLTVTAAGWPENKLSGEDAILLGGALTDTWTAGALIGAAISDDLIVGAGVRITSPVDLFLNGVAGLQERPGTVHADGLFREQYGTLYEREYGSGMHGATVACLSGMVYQTQRTGFRPMMKTAMGVRNLIPGSGAATAEPSPPVPPPGPSSTAVGAAGAGAMVATSAAGGSVGTARGVDNFQDMSRIANAAADLEDASTLHRGEDTADTLDGLAAAARAGGPDADAAGNDGMASVADHLRVDDADGSVPDVSQRLSFDDYSPHGSVDDIDQPLNLFGDIEDAETTPGRVESGDGFPTVARPAVDSANEPPASHVEFTTQIDSGPSMQQRSILDVGADDVVDTFDDTVVDGRRMDGSGGFDQSIVDSAGADPLVEARLNDGGAEWSHVGGSAETSPGAAADASTPTRGDYQRMRSAESGIATRSGSASPNDTPPGVGNSTGGASTLNDSAARRAPDDFNSIEAQVDLDRVYYQHRGASNWRAVEAYGVVNDLREDLRIMVRNLGGNVSDGDLQRLYSEVQRLRLKASVEGDLTKTQQIDRFLDWYDLKVYDTSTSLAGRADEFESALTGVGGLQLLDPDIDKAKLQQWLSEQRDAALARLDYMTDLNDSQVETLGREFPYYHQLWLALKEGRDPIVESLDEITYLRSVNNTTQVDEYMQYHNRFLAFLKSPNFESVDAANQLASVRPELGQIGTIDEATQLLDGRFHTNVMNPQADDAGASLIDGTGEVATVDYGGNREIINNAVGPGDYARLPTVRPHWADDVHFRRILFPTGDPGFEHLFQGSFSAGNIHGIIEGAQSQVDHEADARHLDQRRLGPVGFRQWDAGIRSNLLIRFGDIEFRMPPPDPRRARSEGGPVDLFGMEPPEGSSGKGSTGGGVATGVAPAPRLPRFGPVQNRTPFRGRERVVALLTAEERLDEGHISAVVARGTGRRVGSSGGRFDRKHDSDASKMADLIQRLRTGADMRFIGGRTNWLALDAMRKVLNAVEEVA